jgi:hypothetical protein
MMATLEDEGRSAEWYVGHTDHSEDSPDSATLDTSQTITVPPRQSPGPMLHDVYLEREDGSLVPIASAVEVKGRGLAGRREAIIKATASDEGLLDTERYGTFRVVKHGEMSEPITRTQKTEPVDVWT